MKNKFAKTFKELRKENGLTQTALSKELYVSQTAISQWENGLCEPSLTTLVFVARYFDVSTDYLIGFRDYK